MKNFPIQARVSEAEKKAFQDAAGIVGLSLSAWIRATLRKAAIYDLENVGRGADFLVEEEKHG